MLWTTDEEVGSTTSRALIEAEATKSEAVLVFEPSLPGGALKTSRKGVGQFEMIARGVLGARRPRSGQGRQRDSRAGAADHRHRRSAGSRQRRHADRRHRSGRHARQRGARRGPRHHRRARHHARRRRSRAARDAIADGRSSPARRLEVTGGFDRPPLERSAAVEACSRSGEGGGRRTSASRWRRAAPAAAPTATSPRRIGVPTLDGFGAIGDGAHALHEHVEIDALVPRAATIAGLLARLSEAFFLDADRRIARASATPLPARACRNPSGRICSRRAVRTSSTISGYSRLQHRHEVIARAAFEVHHHRADRARA